jgi:hypothetical protein
MKVRPVFEKAFSQLQGKPCWGVKKGYGSFLTFEFGKPHLKIREPMTASPEASPRVKASLALRTVTVRGDWHLWIYCCKWEIHYKGKRLAHSESPDARIGLAAKCLDGQKLVRFALLRGTRCTFQFDLGGVLKTRPYDTWSEQWLFYGPARVLVLRADNRYSHHRSNKPGTDWKSIHR